MGDLFLPVLTEPFCDPALSLLHDINEVILGRTAMRQQEGSEGSLVTKGLCQQRKAGRACVRSVSDEGLQGQERAFPRQPAMST